MNKAKDALIQMCLTDLDRLQRQKIEAVITIYVHLMEIFRDIVKVTKKLEEFNWQKQNRLYWLEDYDNCIISITDVDFKYSYE
jgi:dynein heavy chain